MKTQISQQVKINTNLNLVKHKNYQSRISEGHPKNLLEGIIVEITLRIPRVFILVAEVVTILSLEILSSPLTPIHFINEIKIRKLIMERARIFLKQ